MILFSNNTLNTSLLKNLSTLLLLAFATIGLNAQVQFKLEKLSDGETFQVSLVPEKDWKNPMNITSTAQVTLKVPTNSFEIRDLVSLQDNVNWEYNSKSTAPKEAPQFDYLSIGLASMGTKQIAYEKGVPVPLFTFKNAEICQGSIALMPQNDPFKAPNSKRANVGNSITVFGARGEAYKENFTTQEIPCQSTLSLETSSTASLENEVRVYPNPAVNLINVDLTWQDRSIEGDFVIIDINGKEVRREVVYVNRGRNKVELAIKDLPTGIFSIEFQNGQQTLVLERFIKQNK